MSSGVTEFLDYTGPVVKDTTETTSGARWARTTGPVSAVEKATVTLSIPAFGPINRFNTVNGFPQFGGGFFNYIFGQFNYTAAKPFTIINYNDGSLFQRQVTQFNYCFPILRWRVGTTVTRYLLLSPWQQHPDNTKQFIPRYSGQVIPIQFSIEIWCWGGSPSVTPPMFNNADLTYKTSILNTPDIVTGVLPYSDMRPTPNDTLFQDFFVNLPQNLPINWNPVSYWNSN